MKWWSPPWIRSPLLWLTMADPVKVKLVTYSISFGWQLFPIYFYLQQECIQVGCILTTVVAIPGGSPLSIPPCAEPLEEAPPGADPPLGADSPGSRHPHASRHPWEQKPPVNKMTDMCKNITLPKLRLWAVKMPIMPTSEFFEKTRLLPLVTIVIRFSHAISFNTEDLDLHK